MCISLDKSCLLYNNIDDASLMNIARSLPYPMEPIHTGCRYLGYFLKPLGYMVCDWHWLVQKFERRICNWTYKLLSLGGRLILVQLVLSSLPVTWFLFQHLSYTSSGELCLPSYGDPLRLIEDII